MFRLIAWQNYALVAGIVLAAGAGWGEYRHLKGTSAERAVWEARTALIRVQRAGAVALAAARAEIILQAAREMAALQAELEEAAHADPDADRPAFGPAAVHRLQRHR